MARISAGPDGRQTQSPPRTTPIADDIGDQAIKTLIKHGFAKKKEANEEFDIIKLSTVLTKITAKVATLPNAGALDESLRAAIILLQDVDDISPAAQTMADANERAKEQEVRMDRAIGAMEKLAEASAAQIEETRTRMEGIVSTIGGLETLTKEAAARAEALSEGQKRGGEIGENGPASFAQVVARAPARHADAVARIAMVRRQVVLGKADGDGADPFKDLTEKDVLAKAHMAVEMMAKEEGLERAGGIKFLHARKTARGGAILVASTDEDASWLREETVIGKFADRMGGALHARADLCMVIAEYVPITFEPGLFTAFGQVERDSGLEKGSLREARYIKQVQFRKSTQRTAHMMMGFASPEQANSAIRKGLIIEGKHVTLRRHRIDPHRCLKCQLIGTAHRAAECKSIHDTCGRCAGMHRTATCKVDDPAAFKCVNCKTTGHATVDRNCPKFLEKMRDTHARFPDYQYRFFPTQDPETWEKEEYGLGARTDTPERDNGARQRDFPPSGYSGGGQYAHAYHRDGNSGRSSGRPRDNGWPNRRAAHGATTAGTEAERRPAEAFRQTTLDGEMHWGGLSARPVPLEYGPESGARKSAWGDTETEGRGDSIGSRSLEYADA